MTELTPLIMSPVLAEKPWGGRRLSAFGKQLPDGVWIGESWEIADLPPDSVTTVADPRSRVSEGPHRGKALRDLIAEYGADFLGSAAPTAAGDFPLLVKLLDAREHLSVQVHPDEAYVAAHPEARLKTESWYVVGAAPDAHMYLGLRDGIGLEAVASRIGTSAIAGVLDIVPAVTGDFHHLPAGLIHALGAGVTVAEVQTPSDTTFRIYDWEDRYDRTARDMHTTEALEAIRPEMHSTHVPRAEEGRRGVRDLISTSAYWIREHITDGLGLQLREDPEVRVIMNLQSGVTIVLPAAIAGRTALMTAPGAVVLEIGLV